MSFAAAKKESFLKKPSTPDVPCDPAPSVMGAAVLLNPVYVTPPGVLPPLPNVPDNVFPPLPGVIDPAAGNGDEEEKEDEDEEGNGKEEEGDDEDEQGDGENDAESSPFKIADEM